MSLSFEWNFVLFKLLLKKQKKNALNFTPNSIIEEEGARSPCGARRAIKDLERLSKKDAFLVQGWMN